MISCICNSSTGKKSSCFLRHQLIVPATRQGASHRQNEENRFANQETDWKKSVKIGE
jgi:hypothetical protein